MSKVSWYVLFGSLAFIFLLLTVYFLLMKSPEAKGGKCAFGCNIAPSWLNGPECLSVLEKSKDDNIPAPSASLQPYLSDFKMVDGAGPAFCTPAWYAFRYVRNSDGGYGPLSLWTGQKSADDKEPMAIYSCAASLPCIPSAKNCSSLTGPGSSSFNKPIIALINPLDLDIKNGQVDGYTLNVHRQIGIIDNNKASSFDPASEGTIIGSFIVYSTPINGIYANFGDGIFWPDPKSTSSSCC